MREQCDECPWRKGTEYSFLGKRKAKIELKEPMNIHRCHKMKQTKLLQFSYCVGSINYAKTRLEELL